MKSRKKLTAIAKSLYKKSFKDSTIDNLKVRQIAAELASQRKPGVSTILKIYKKLIEQSIAKEEIIVESAVPPVTLKKIESELLEKTNARRVKYKFNPKSLIGAKITHGDWVWDGTLDARLAKLLNC